MGSGSGSGSGSGWVGDMVGVWVGDMVAYVVKILDAVIHVGGFGYHLHNGGAPVRIRVNRG